MPNPGDRISEYLLVEPLGRGTFGEVWRAHHHVWLDQFVAVKIPTDPQYVRSLQREGTAVHGLRHPNIVRALGFDPYGSPAYLVMEYVPGTSLRPLIAERRLGIEDAVAVLGQVLRGLGHAHGTGLVHRDVKPENVLVHEAAFEQGFATGGLVKVTDFGLGKAANATAAQSIAMSMSLGGADAANIAGTLDYMAPEQRAGLEVDHRADLYACGVMLYELLTGEKPAGTDLPSDLNPAVPKPLDEVFKRSYARLEKRFASADEFLEVLQASTLAAGTPAGRTPARGRAGVIAGRPDAPMDCPQCRRQVRSRDQFCIHCGNQLVTQVRRCGSCGAYPDASDRFCIRCGTQMEQQLLTQA
ncbi:MAG: serine/threonine-protein kinase [Phycisphaerae bacterium]